MFVRNKKNQGGVVPVRNDIKSVTFYSNIQSVFNRFFTKNMLERLGHHTDLYIIKREVVENILSLWSNSSDEIDNIYNLSTPSPNVKDFLWNDIKLNEEIAKR